MALINCPECNTEISEQSEKCVKCGFPIKPIATIPIIQKKIVVQQKEEGLFLQTMNYGCGCVFLLIALIIGFIIWANFQK